MPRIESDVNLHNNSDNKKNDSTSNPHKTMLLFVSGNAYPPPALYLEPHIERYRVLWLFFFFSFFVCK